MKVAFDWMVVIIKQLYVVYLVLQLYTSISLYVCSYVPKKEMIDGYIFTACKLYKYLSYPKRRVVVTL